MALLSKNVSESLLAIQAVSITGEVYRIIFGKKKLISEVRTEPPEKMPDNVVIYSKEQDAGQDFTKYSIDHIEVEKPDATSINQGDVKIELGSYFNEKGNDINPDGGSDSTFIHFPRYTMEAKVFNYRIVPTLTKGPKILRQNISPNRMMVLDGRLSKYFIPNSTSLSTGYQPDVNLRPASIKQKTDKSVATEITY